MALLPSSDADRKRLAIGVLPIVLLVGYWYFVHQDRAAAIADAETRLEQLQSANQAAKLQMAQGGPRLEERVALYQQYMQRLEQLIPEREEVPELLHSMTQQAQENRVELALMKPEDERRETYYTRQTYDMAVIGAYHDVGRFLASIGSLPRIVAPIELALEPNTPKKGQDAPSASAPKVEATFKIQTFVLPSPGAPGADSGSLKKGAPRKNAKPRKN